MKEDKKVSLTGKAIKYLQKKYPGISFMKDIIIMDKSDGNGPYIHSWGLSDPQPTEAELNQEAENAPVSVELPPKPTIEESLAMIYNDMKNGTRTFVETMDKYVK
jgi:hypothetical protein